MATFIDIHKKLTSIRQYYLQVWQVAWPYKQMTDKDCYLSNNINGHTAITNLLLLILFSKLEKKVG